MSNQKVETPVWFIKELEDKLLKEKFGFDLAASRENSKALFYFDEDMDSLKQNWDDIHALCWLNSPFKNVGKWIEKASCSKNKIVQICELSGDANRNSAWWSNEAHIMICHGRLWPVEVRSVMLIFWRVDVSKFRHCIIDRPNKKLMFR